MNLVPNIAKTLFVVAVTLCSIPLHAQHAKDVKEKLKKTIIKDFDIAKQQYYLLAQKADSLNSFPRTIDTNGQIKGTSEWDWTGGFFPGGLWYIYQFNQDEQTKNNAIKWTEALEKAKDLTAHHDIGFVMYCSYGNAVKLLKDSDKVKAYQDVLIHSAESALKRYDPKVGLIKSWNRKESWDGKTVWTYPVIIDNLMNLEMLCYASTLTGNPKYRNVAISHANHTMKNHFRADYSTYHVVDYDPESGAVLKQQTNQGYADNSTWSRGQAWAIYGYTFMYREIKDANYLKTAVNAADYYINHKNMPKDGIPYWDFNAGKKGYNSDVDFTGRKDKLQSRDASAAAIVASALLELAEYVDAAKAKKYITFAEKTLMSLSSSRYLASVGTNEGFLLKHSTGSMPHNVEIDKPLIYADYYFLEALNRYWDKFGKK